jgi:hypothetical protein
MSQTSLSDILTAAKNLVQAVNGLQQTYLDVQGAQTIENISTTTLLKNSDGRVARVSVITAGVAVGHIYDGNSLNATTKPLFVIPNTVGVYDVLMPVSYGIVVVPSISQVVAVSFS